VRFLVEVLTLVGVFVTVTVYCCQLRAMRATAEVTRQSADTAQMAAIAAQHGADATATQAAITQRQLLDSERAHVRLSKIIHDPQRDSDDVFGFMGYFRNFGPAPAFEVTSTLGYAVGRIPPTPNSLTPTITPTPTASGPPTHETPTPTLRPVPEGPFSVSAIEAHDERQFKFTTPLTVAESLAIKAGNCALYLWAESKFQDLSRAWPAEPSCMVTYNEGPVTFGKAMPCRRDVVPPNDCAE